MNSHRNHLTAGCSLLSMAFAMIAIGAMLAFGMADASAAGARAGGGGGRMAQHSVSGANRSMARPSTGNVNAGNRVGAGQLNTGNRVNTGNVNAGNRVNTGNINVGNDINIDIDGGYGYRPGYGGGYYHPIAAGVVIGSVAVTTAAVMGSYYRTLPPGCTVVVRGGISYHYCGSVYYQQTWSGNDVVYVVVNP